MESVADDETRRQGPPVKLEHFEGPLDLLIFLIRTNEVNIYDIPIARITEQFLEYLAFAVQIDLDNVTEFYLMAATLLYIKSRLLLPVEDEDAEDWDDPRKELVDRLIEYQRYRKLTELMIDQAEQNDTYLQRKASQPPLPFTDDEEIWESIDVWDLLKTFSGIIANISTDRLVSLYEEVTVNEKLTLIAECIENGASFRFEQLIVHDDSVMEVVCAFIALLEAVRQKTVRVVQNRLFGDIRIVPGGQESADG